MSIYRTPGAFHLQVDCEGRGFFSYPDGQGLIDIYWEDGGTPAEHYLLSSGLAVYLELMGQPCLHGDGLSYRQMGFGLLGGSAAGKSTLASALARYGCLMLSDDILPLDPARGGYRVHPSVRLVRLWPDSIEGLMGAIATVELPRVHANHGKRLVQDAVDFDTEARELRVLYVLDRRANCESPRVVIERLNPADALIRLLRESALVDAATALGVESSRFKILAGVAGSIPVKTVSYPSGYDLLPEVCRCLIDDFSEQSGNPAK